MISNHTRDVLRKASVNFGAMSKLIKGRHLAGAAIGAGMGAMSGGKNGRLRGALIGGTAGAAAGHFLGRSKGLIKAGKQAKKAFGAIPKGQGNFGAYKNIGKNFGKSAWNTLKGNTAMQAGTAATAVGLGSMYGNRRYQKVMNNPVVQIGKGIHNFMNR